MAPQLVARTLRERRALRRQARPAGLSLSGWHRRFERALTWWLAHSAPGVVPAGPLVLLVDGVWFRFAKQVWTLYVMAVKPVGSDRVTVLDPVLRPGKERARDWHVAVATIPPAVEARIRAFVSDGFRGAHALSRAHGWIPQRCHFHLIAQLQSRRGWYKHLPSARVREAVYQAVREALVTPCEARLAQLRGTLTALAQQRDCPQRFRMIVHDFLRQLAAFRAYRYYPALTLPTTTNVLEALANILRVQLRSLSTPGALQRWATALIRLRPTMVCNGHKNQPD